MDLAHSERQSKLLTALIQGKKDEVKVHNTQISLEVVRAKLSELVRDAAPSILDRHKIPSIEVDAQGRETVG